MSEEPDKNNDEPSVQDIVAPTATDLPDDKARLEQQQLEHARIENDLSKAKEELRTLQLNNAELNRNIESRDRYTNKLYKLTCTWLAIVLLIILVTGFRKIWVFELSDTVLVALITTTTINVIAIFKGVTEYIYPVNRMPKVDAPKTDIPKEEDKK